MQPLCLHLAKTNQASMLQRENIPPCRPRRAVAALARISFTIAFKDAGLDLDDAMRTRLRQSLSAG